MDIELFLPSLPHWTYENPWSGSYRKVRYYITVADGEMKADIWLEDISHELAEITVTKSFPLTQEGLDEMRGWLIEQCDHFNS